MSSPARILITGFGSIGRKHLETVRRVFPEAEVTILKKTDSGEMPPEGVKLFRLPEEARSYSPEVVIVASPAMRHREDVELFAGVAERILLEKPLAASVTDATSIGDTVRASALRAIVGYNLRYFRPLALFREMLLGEEYGPLRRLECHVGQHLSQWRGGKDPSASVSSRKDLGGGAFRELSHEIDYALWICGSPSGVRARASRHLDYGDAEDCVDLWLDFDGDRHSCIHLDMIDRSVRRTARAVCERGTLELDFLSSTLRVNGDLLDIGSSDTVSETYERELRDLCGDGQNSPAATCEDGIAVLRVIETAEHSLKGDLT